MNILAADVSTTENIIPEEITQIGETIENTDINVIQKYISDNIPTLLSFAVRVVLLIVFLIICMKLIKLVRKIVRRSLETAGVEEGAKQFIDSLTKVILYFLVVLIIGSEFGLTASSVAALLGTAGLTVGLALQGGLGNFAGGVLILLLKPFKVGDYIMTSVNNLEGTVNEIQLFYTKLKTVDNKVVVIPNGTLTDNSIVNYSDQDKRMIKILVSIDYKSDIKTAKKLLMNILDDEKEILSDEDCIVYVDELADSAVIIGMRFWVKTEDYFPVKWKVTEIIKEVLDDNNITIPYNQLDVTIVNK